MNAATKESLSKVPEVTLIFWIIKIAATTLGETGGDAVSMSMNLGFVVISCIGVCVGKIKITIQDVNVAVQVCAAVQALNVSVLSGLGVELDCTLKQF